MQIYIDEILATAIEIEKQKNNLQLGKEDIRNKYLGMICDLLTGYLNGYISLKIYSEITTHRDLIPKLNISNKEISLIEHTSNAEMGYISFLSHQHRNLLISSWSAFELLVTTLCEHLPDKDKEKLLKYEYNEYLDYIKEEKIDQFSKKVIKKHLTHVPVPRKIKALKKHYSFQADCDFFDFLGKLRNTMHTNFIYHGKETYRYKLDEDDFIFEPGKVFRYPCKDDDVKSPTIYLNVIQKLVASTIPFLKIK